MAAVLIAALALAGCGSSSPPTVHRGLLESMFQDDLYTLYQPNAAAVSRTLGTLKALGVDTVRVQVLWSNIAPDPTSAIQPAGFDASGPGRKPIVGNAAGIAPGQAGKVSSSLFEPVDAVSVPLHTNGKTLDIGGEDDDVDVPPFMRR